MEQRFCQSTLLTTLPTQKLSEGEASDRYDHAAVAE